MFTIFTLFKFQHASFLLSLDLSMNVFFILEKSKERKGLFVLNKKPEKVALNRRTLYYKIPVNFVTAADTGNTFVVPRQQPTREESAARRSQPSVPENPLVDADSLKYGDFRNENANAKDRDFNEENGEDNPDIQAEYIRDQLDHSTENISPERLSLFAKTSDESVEPLFENVKMVEPEKKSIEDECKFLPV